MKPDDLDDTAPPEPDDGLLEQVHSRSVSFGQRRRLQRFGSVASVALVLVLAAGVALVRVDNSDGNKVSVPPSTTSTTTPPEVTAATLSGDWSPVTIADYGGPLTSPPLSSVPLIRFTTAHEWTGSDGCNGQSGSYDLGPNGAIHFGESMSEAMACARQTPQLRLLQTATRVEISYGILTFLGPDRELAQYTRPVTARIVLPSATMIAGSSMKGRVIVDNHTGHALHVFGCGGIFAVTLSNAEVSQGAVIWTQCRMPITIPVGSTTYPVTAQATYYECSNVPSPTLRRCVDGRPPPLPPGIYQATLAQSTTVAPTPAPVDVTVLPSEEAVNTAGLRTAALAWSKAFLTGTPDDIFGMEGPECKQQTGTTLGKDAVSAYLSAERAAMKQHFGVPLDAITNHGVSVRNVTGDSGKALVLYDLPESKTGNDNWVTYARHDGEWKVADCHAPIGGSSSSASSSAPPAP